MAVHCSKFLQGFQARQVLLALHLSLLMVTSSIQCLIETPTAQRLSLPMCMAFINNTHRHSKVDHQRATCPMEASLAHRAHEEEAEVMTQVGSQQVLSFQDQADQVDLHKEQAALHLQEEE